MTKLVIILWPMTQTHPILRILNLWPSRRAVLEDVNASLPEGRKLDMVAIHRWFQRKSIPSEYDAALIDGASKRNIALNWRELMEARAAHADQSGHCAPEIQGEAH